MPHNRHGNAAEYGQKIDRQWFIDRLNVGGKSMRDLAKHLDMDVSAVSRTFSGGRRLQMHEAEAIAHFLNAPVAEVLRHAGVMLEATGKPATVLLAATITAKGVIERLKEPRPLPANFIERAHAAIRPDPASPVVAAQVRASNGGLSMFDDAVVLFKATDMVEPSAIGTMAICRCYEGQQIVAKIERARKTGEAKIVTVDGKTHEVMLQTASPILAIIP